MVIILLLLRSSHSALLVDPVLYRQCQEARSFTCSELYAPPQHVDSRSRGVGGLRSHPRSSRGRSMHDTESELLRILLSRTGVAIDVGKMLKRRTVDADGRVREAMARSSVSRT